MKLVGRVALVTGASRGIGRAIAIRLAQQGAEVVVHYRSQSQAAAEVLALCGGKARALACDLADHNQLIQFAHTLSEIHPRLHILVHNAGATEEVSFEKTSEGQFDRILSVNLKAPFFLTQKLLPLLAPGARIVHIGSHLAHVACPAEIAYTLAKAGLETLTLQLAALLGERNITVNAIAPGTIETDMCQWLEDPEQRQAAVWQQAIQRLGQPADVAAAVEFLVGPEAGWVTGQVLRIDGGFAL